MLRRGFCHFAFLSRLFSPCHSLHHIDTFGLFFCLLFFISSIFFTTKGVNSILSKTRTVGRDMG